MIQVRIDSEDMNADFGEIRTIADLIELVKTTIDPDSILTSILMDGKPLGEGDWRSSISVFNNSVLEVVTGEKSIYFRERIVSAEEILAQIIVEFAAAGDEYRQGSSDEANALLAQAVDDLLAFISWYASLLNMEAAQMADYIEKFDAQIREIQTICEKLIQQQMYHSWWVLGEMLRSKLIPELESLKGLCIEAAGSYSVALPV